MRGAITPFPPYVFMAWFLIKHGDKFSSIFNMCPYDEYLMKYNKNIYEM